MNVLKLLSYSTLRVFALPNRPCINYPIRRFRRRSVCDICCFPQDKRPCFDMEKICYERGNTCHAPLIRSFLYTHYWPREPSVSGLWMDLNCAYLDILTDKHCFSGDRFLAFESMPRTFEKKLVGVLVANTIWPWMIAEYEEWAHYTSSKPERHRMYFCAHVLKSPNLYKKYNVNYIYDVEILGTAAEATGQGVATRLLGSALQNAEELRHPLVQVVSVSQYTAIVCERCGMTREWTMDYSEFVDDSGQRVFFPRSPHRTVAIYVKYFDPKVGQSNVPCKPPY